MLAVDTPFARSHLRPDCLFHLIPHLSFSSRHKGFSRVFVSLCQRCRRCGGAVAILRRPCHNNEQSHGSGSSKEAPQRAQTQMIAKRLAANTPIRRFPVFRHQPIRRHTLVEVSEHLLIRLQVIAHISVYSKPLAYPFLLLYRGKSLHEFPDEQSNILFSIHFYINI
jgi:hypothetical protein